MAVPQPPDGWQIWVAEGTYVPNPNGGTTVNATFTLRNNVRVFGGFGGDEANLVERDLSQHVTVLDGFIPDPVPAECGAPGSGSCVVAHGGHPENCDDGTGTAGCEDPGCCSLVCATFPYCCETVWDQCCADVAAEPSFCGPDGVVEAGESVLHVVTVTGAGGTRRLDGVTVRRGKTDGGTGAGLYLADGGLDIVSCTFEDNSAAVGGGIGWADTAQTSFALTQIANCRFTRNEATKAGGAIYATHRFTIANSLFHDNGVQEPEGAFSQELGGAICDAATATPRRIINCTIVRNTAGNGGGVATSTSASGLEIRNCILWDNEADTAGDQIFGAPTTVAYSDIEGGGFAGTGNLNVDPDFADAVNGDFTLLEGSLVVDKGDSSVDLVEQDLVDADVDGVTTEDAFDLAVLPRIRVSSPGTCPTVDMGAFELQGYCALGDINGDNNVDGADLGLLLGAWGPCSATPCVGDFNCDDVVDGADLGLVLGAWGPGYPRNCGLSSFSSAMSSGPGSEMSGISLEDMVLLQGLDSTQELIEWLTSLPFEEMVFWLQQLG